VNYKLLLAHSNIKSICNKATEGIAVRLKRNSNIETLIDLIKSNFNNIFLEKRSVFNQIPRSILPNLIENIDRYANSNVNFSKQICIGYNKWISFNKLNTLLFRNLMSNNHDEIPNKSFINIKKITMNPQYRDFQFKLMHGIINTRDKLFKFKFTENNYCLTCAENNVLIKDDIAHSLFECTVAVETWVCFKSVFQTKLALTLDITLRGVIDGFDIGPKYKIVNETAIQVKKLLHKPMSIRKIINNQQIEKIFDNLYKLSCYYKSMKINEKV